MQYKITPGLEELFVEAKAKAKKEKKEKDELVVESADEILTEVTPTVPTTKDEIIKMLETDINAAAEAYTKLESDEDKAAVRAAIAQKAAIEKEFDDAVKRFMQATEDVNKENQEKQEIAEPVNNNTLEDTDSNMGNNDQDYEPANVAPSVGGEENNPESAGVDFTAPVTASIKEQLVVEAEYHLRHGLDKKAYLNAVKTIYNNDKISKAASTIFDNAVSTKQPSNLRKTAEKMDMLLQAAAAYREQKPDYEGYLKIAAESTSGEEWLRKLAKEGDDDLSFPPHEPDFAPISSRREDDYDNDNSLPQSVEDEQYLKDRIKQLDEELAPADKWFKNPTINIDLLAKLAKNILSLVPKNPGVKVSKAIRTKAHALMRELYKQIELAKIANKKNPTGIAQEAINNYDDFLKSYAIDKWFGNPFINTQGSVVDSIYAKGITKTAAKLDEVPANNKEHPGQKMFNNGKSTQENGNTPEDFPGNKLFDETNTAVETVFPEGQVTQDQIIKDRTVIKDLSKIKDVNDQTIAVMQPIVVEPVNLGDSAENNMKDFFFNGNNITRSPEPSKTLPAGKPAHEVDDVIVSMDELSKKAK